VIRKIHPTSADFDNLSRLKTDPGEAVSAQDFSAVVVKKPWGYEYLWFQNASVAIWVLHLLPGQATSLHCHIRKRTSLIVADGQVVCSTIGSRYRLGVADAVVLEPCVFHTTQAISDEGACVMEIETPPMKGDLVRMKDSFGRAGQGYEDKSQYETNLGEFEYQPWPGAECEGCSVRSLKAQIRRITNQNQWQSVKERSSVVMPVSERLRVGPKMADVGEAVPVDLLRPHDFPGDERGIDLLILESTTR